MTALLAAAAFTLGAVCVAIPYSRALRRAKARAVAARHRATLAAMVEIMRCDKANYSALSDARRN